MKTASLTMFALVVAGMTTSTNVADEPIDIGSRLELFVDSHLIDRLDGDARQHLHRPTPREVVLTTDEPWEGNTSAYFSIFADNGLYRMYYRGSHFDEQTKKATHPEVTCYAESKDGIHWTKPALGLFEYDGSKENNIVWRGVGTHCFTPFKDENPDCPADARYKAISRGRPIGKKGLYVFKSADGVVWSLMHPDPVITKGAFDSQNLAFWDPHIKKYREYHRIFTDGVRDVMTGTSTDFVHWTDPVLLDYPGASREHLYTNAVRFYERAPHILIGFPTRYLPNENSRVEPVLMTSRDGRTFHRFKEAVISEDAPKDRRGNRSNYMTWGLLSLPGDDMHLSVYATEAYYTGPDSRVRRFEYRVDGFVSVRGSNAGGSLLTKPLTFAGKSLAVNYATKKGGSLRVELQNADGEPLDGFSLDDCRPMRGSEIEQSVAWKNGGDVSALAGKPVRLRFKLKNADLFSMTFNP